jgi:hypothetical protein
MAEVTSATRQLLQAVLIVTANNVLGGLDRELLFVLQNKKDGVAVWSNSGLKPLFISC